MKIRDLVCTSGWGGYFWRDEEAIKKGAVGDGLVYHGLPITPGGVAGISQGAFPMGSRG
jgi:methylaspartate ammonia-lyase